jgi:hypothetical protein
VTLTANEWIKAQRFGDPYRLDLVTDCKTKPELDLIQNPADELIPREEVSVIRYLAAQGELAASCVSGPQDRGPHLAEVENC